jgi:AraC-like DNA-binding protein
MSEASMAEPARHVWWRPAAALSPYVRSMTAYDVVVEGPGTHRGLPSTSLTMVLPVEEPIDVEWLGRANTRSARWSCVSGLHVAPAEIHHRGRQAGIQLGLTPLAARALFGLPAAELSGVLTDLDRVAPTLADLPARLAEAMSWRQRLALVEARLLDALARTSGAAPRPEIEWTLRRLSRPTTVSGVAGEVGFSRRHLSQLFRAEYGVTPKQYQRIARFQSSHRTLARQLRAGCVSLARTAVGSGYADQAHLTREWAALAGYTPTAWLRAEFPFLQDAAEDAPVA